jgi:hypothetical protein
MFVNQIYAKYVLMVNVLINATPSIVKGALMVNVYILVVHVKVARMGLV